MDSKIIQFVPLLSRGFHSITHVTFTQSKRPFLGLCVFLHSPVCIPIPIVAFTFPLYYIMCVTFQL